MTTLATATNTVPPELNPSDWSQLEPLYRALLERSIDSTDALERWLADWSELDAVVDEHGSRLYIDRACHTDDEEKERAFLHFVEHVDPKLKPLHIQLKRKLLDSPHRKGLTGSRFKVLERSWRADLDLFRDQNIPLQTELTKLNADYDKIIGAMTVEFRGKTHTLQRMARYLQETDRPTREEAWRLVADRRLQGRQRVDEIFDRMIALRHEMSRNADLPDHRAYAWLARKRFDYTPADCEAFHDAIERTVVPLCRKLHEQRRAALGLPRLRPWDLAVDVKGRAPLDPFDADEPQALVDGCRTVLERLSPRLAQDYATLRMGRHLDLESRPGKQAGGFQCSLTASGEPFIFMNAAGVHRDVTTMLHEAGHAFHFVWAYRREPRLHFRGSGPMEFNEVASMSLELLTADHLDVFYPDRADADRARREHLEQVITLLPWIATIDAFQHWLYTHPQHGRDERTEAWLATLGRFESGAVDWSDLDEPRAAMWQRQGHLFHASFYYIEYGIAQLGALQLWQRFRQDPDAALAGYRAALELGGTRPLPELFRAAGLRFDFSAATLEPLMRTVEHELSQLPV